MNENTSTMSINHQPPPRTEDEWAASMRYADEHAGEHAPSLGDIAVAKLLIEVELFRRAYWNAR